MLFDCQEHAEDTGNKEACAEVSSRKKKAATVCLKMHRWLQPQKYQILPDCFLRIFAENTSRSIGIEPVAECTFIQGRPDSRCLFRISIYYFIKSQNFLHIDRVHNDDSFSLLAMCNGK